MSKRRVEPLGPHLVRACAGCRDGAPDEHPYMPLTDIEWLDRLGEMEAKVEKQEAALREYGQHIGTCERRLPEGPGFQPPCTCGLAALGDKQKPQEETPCPVREDGQHCDHWYDDSGPCCGCGDNEKP